MRRIFYLIALVLATVGAYTMVGQIPEIASFLFAAVAVIVPQIIAIAFLKKHGAGRAFGAWAFKFSLSFLFMALSVRLLYEAALLSGLFFVAGCTVGVFAGIALAVRSSRRFESLEA